MHRLDALRTNIQRVYLGNQAAIEKLLICLLARGHVLIEDVPGVGKTILATALARSLDCSMARLQLTPDLLPSDVLGVTVWDQQRGEFVFKPGPIFHNVVLADEINRTTPRTQSALLEAMNEAQVSIDGVTRKLIQPFMVIATQNPFEFEGTYPLPESQLDRFLLRIHIGYPTPQQERDVLRAQQLRHPLEGLEAVVSKEDVLTLQRAAREVKVDEAILDYIVTIAQRSRESAELAVGVSPRGSLCLRRCAQALALVRGRDYVIPDDIKELARPVLAHRVVIQHEPGAGRQRAEEIIGGLLEAIPVPL